MIQKKYLCKDIPSARDAIRRIGELVSDTPHRDALVTFYETGLSKQEIDQLLAEIRALGIPGLQTAGISIPMIAELMPEPTGVLFNLIMTDEADIEVVTVPCEPGDEAKAARMLRDRLDSCDFPRAVELFGSNMALNTTAFMEKAMEGHEDTVLFGTSTIRNLPQKLSVEKSESVVEVEQVDLSQARDELIAGDSILYDGFVAIIFAGEKLKVQAEYALGWNPVGRKFPIVIGEDPACGETVVTNIDSMPAVDIYREYLGVYPDSFLISNVCEFPLVVERDGINICMIPLDCNKDGDLNFMMTLRPDEELRFTFASHDEVLYASRRSLEIMENFRPETLFLTLCGNRINFLKEDAHIEWDEFGSISPDFALMHGACELFYHQGKGGILNSAHLAIGLREGEGLRGGTAHSHPTLESMRHGRPLSLSDRMSTFLAKITTELLDTVAEARDANNAKSAFLSHMSHEIRTPINAILGMDEMILQDSREKETLEYAESIRSAGNNLLGIVNDVLDFSKIEAGKMNIVPAAYELASVVNDMYNMVRLRAEDKGLTVKLDIDPTLPSILFGDDKRIKQVITNLLTNAVKYTEKGTISLGIRQIPSAAGDADDLQKACPGDKLPDKIMRIAVSVKDTGIGIKAEDFDRLFDEYERFDKERNRKVEGTGLGLSITTELLELMGSRLSVTSTYGEGSEFGFEIVQGVVSDEPVGDMTARFAASPGRRKRATFTAEDAHILVVDDSAVNLTVVKNLLRKTMIKIDTASSGEEALDLVRAHAYDVVFLDHLMPQMDGPETLKRMRKLEDNKSADAPVIALTANAVRGAKEEYLAAGFRDYLFKPINLKEMEDMLFYYIPPEKIRTVP